MCMYIYVHIYIYISWVLTHLHVALFCQTTLSRRKHKQYLRQGHQCATGIQAAGGYPERRSSWFMSLTTLVHANIKAKLRHGKIMSSKQ